MANLIKSMAVVDGLREAAGRCWWGEIGLENSTEDRYSVHYRDLVRSGRSWRRRQLEKGSAAFQKKGNIKTELRAEDIYLRRNLLYSLREVYGSKAGDMADKQLGAGALTCVQVRKAVDAVRREKESFRHKFFLTLANSGDAPLPGTFDALAAELEKETDLIPREFWKRGGAKTLRRLASEIIERTGEGLSEELRFSMIRGNIREFFTQRLEMMTEVTGELKKLKIGTGGLEQDLAMLSREYLLHPSVMLLLPEGARGQLMMTICESFCLFLKQNPADSVEQMNPRSEIPSESRRLSMTEFIFGTPAIPEAFEVTNQVRYLSEMSSYHRFDGGVHYTIVPASLSSRQQSSNLETGETPHDSDMSFGDQRRSSEILPTEYRREELDQEITLDEARKIAISECNIDDNDTNINVDQIVKSFLEEGNKITWVEGLDLMTKLKDVAKMIIEDKSSKSLAPDDVKNHLRLYITEINKNLTTLHEYLECFSINIDEYPTVQSAFLECILSPYLFKGSNYDEMTYNGAMYFIRDKFINYLRYVKENAANGGDELCTKDAMVKFIGSENEITFSDIRSKPLPDWVPRPTDAWFTSEENQVNYRLQLANDDESDLDDESSSDLRDDDRITIEVEKFGELSLWQTIVIPGWQDVELMSRLKELANLIVMDDSSKPPERNDLEYLLNWYIDEIKLVLDDIKDLLDRYSINIDKYPTLRSALLEYILSPDFFMKTQHYGGRHSAEVLSIFYRFLIYLLNVRSEGAKEGDDLCTKDKMVEFIWSGKDVCIGNRTADALPEWVPRPSAQDGSDKHDDYVITLEVFINERRND